MHEMPDPTKEEELTARKLERWNNERDIRELLTVLKKGKILEVGCGTGKIIEDLSRSAPKSVFVGIDISDYFLRIATKKNITNAIFIKANATNKIFLSNSFDCVLFRDSLHEIRRSLGEKEVKNSIKTAYDILKSAGRIIVRDSIEPRKELIKMKFINSFFRREFGEFSKSLEEELEYKGGLHYAELDMKGVIAFLTRLYMKELGVVDKLEKSRLGSAFTLKQFDELLKESSFKQLEIRQYPFPKELIPQGILLEPATLPNSYCMLVYEK